MNYSEFGMKYDKKKIIDLPEFIIRQEDKETENPIYLGTRGIRCNENVDPVTEMFFSRDNIKRLQHNIRKEVALRTNNRFKLDVDQDETNLIVAMQAVFFDPDDGARNLPFGIVRQVKELNRKLINYIVPDMISEMKQEYEYIQEINRPLQPMPQPINVSSAGRKTLPSITTQYV